MLQSAVGERTWLTLETTAERPFKRLVLRLSTLIPTRLLLSDSL